MDYILFAAVIAVLIAGFWIVSSIIKKQLAQKKDDQSMLLLQQQIGQITQTMDSRLGETAKLLREEFGKSSETIRHVSQESSRIVRDVTERLTRLDETNRQVVGFADQLKNLQDILKNPKQRGILGEYYLELVLKNGLPPGSYQMQYAFSNGVVVDAAIMVDKRIIPVDSKFSLENYNRILESREGSPERKKYEQAFIADLKLRIDETAKYVKPEENTMDFAFMFIPSEAVYYDLLINKVGAIGDDTRNLVSYAGQKKVIIVSPTSFLAYLQTVLQGLRNQKISEQAKDIIKQVENLGRHLISYDDYMRRLGKNLGTSVSMYNQAYKEFGKIDKDVLKITGIAIKIEPRQLEKPVENK